MKQTSKTFDLGPTATFDEGVIATCSHFCCVGNKIRTIQKSYALTYLLWPIANTTLSEILMFIR